METQANPPQRNTFNSSQSTHTNLNFAMTTSPKQQQKNAARKKLFFNHTDMKSTPK